MFDYLEFGKLIKKLRQEKMWNVREFIDRIGDKVSPSYITSIELHGHLPSPRFIIKIAVVFNYDHMLLFTIHEKIKVKKFKDSLYAKYGKALYDTV